MFPRLRQRLGAHILDRLDLLVQFSTLGEYGLDQAGAGAPAPRQRGDCALPRWAGPVRARR